MSEIVVKVYTSYIKDDIEVKIFEKIAVSFLFAYYVLPQYFGIPIPLFDLTAQRIMIIMVLILIFDKRKRSKDFFNLISNNYMTPFILMFLMITFYTGVFRGNVGTFMYPFIEFLALFLLIYIIKNVLGVKRTIKILLRFILLLCILGIVEFTLKRSLFSYLETIQGLNTGIMIRSGSYRIMGPGNHSLAYGLILITAIPFACIDFDKNQIDIIKRPFLFLLIVVNIFLTGSRSTLAVFGLEIVLLFLFSSSINRKKTFSVLMILGTMIAFSVFLTYGSSFSNYILLQITSIIDQIMGTEYALFYGGDITTLQNSSKYREVLIRVFTVNWLNPFLGKGSGYGFKWFYKGALIRSIDNYYIVLYIKYAYPGLIAYMIFILKIFITMIKKANQNMSGASWGLIIGALSYFINLWYVDTLQTIKYVYILFAILYCMDKNSSWQESRVGAID